MRSLARTRPFLLILLGVVAAALPLIRSSRSGGVVEDSATFFVTTAEDGGPGSLRSAIFAADRALARARIVARVARIELSAPLPPLANPKGIELEGVADGTELVAADWGSSPILDVLGPTTVIRRITLRQAPAEGVLVRAARVTLEDLVLVDCLTGVHVGAGISGTVIQGSSLTNNETGLRLEAADSTSVVSNHFAGNQTALFALAAGEPRRTRLVVRDNEFRENRNGVVLSNVTATVERNLFSRTIATAIHVAGGASQVRSNRIFDGDHTGILLEASVGTTVHDNEVARNAAIGIHLRSARNTAVRSNRLYANGYGITTMYDFASTPNVISENLLIGQRLDGIVVIAGAPIIRTNRVLESGGAGIRLLDVTSAAGPPVEASPLLTGNALSGNVLDAPVHEIFEGDEETPVEG